MGLDVFLERNQRADGELPVDADVMMRAVVHDHVELDVGKRLREAGDRVVLLLCDVAAGVDGQYAALGLGLTAGSSLPATIRMNRPVLHNAGPGVMPVRVTLRYAVVGNRRFRLAPRIRFRCLPAALAGVRRGPEGLARRRFTTQ